jgi:hypothetical protein
VALALEDDDDDDDDADVEADDDDDAAEEEEESPPAEDDVLVTDVDSVTPDDVMVELMELTAKLVLDNDDSEPAVLDVDESLNAASAMQVPPAHSYWSSRG